MGVSLSGMENFSYIFFSEIERKTLKKKIGSILKDKKKAGVGTSRELKRLESTINYDGRKGDGKGVNGVKLIGKILSWNVRGLNNRGKRLIVKGCLKNWNPRLFASKKPRWMHSQRRSLTAFGKLKKKTGVFLLQWGRLVGYSYYGRKRRLVV